MSGIFDDDLGMPAYLNPPESAGLTRPEERTKPGSGSSDGGLTRPDIKSKPGVSSPTVEKPQVAHPSLKLPGGVSLDADTVHKIIDDVLPGDEKGKPQYKVGGNDVFLPALPDEASLFQRHRWLGPTLGVAAAGIGLYLAWRVFNKPKAKANRRKKR